MFIARKQKRTARVMFHTRVHPSATETHTELPQVLPFFLEQARLTSHTSVSTPA
eukprot:SAG22_NODE_3405_length_1731_cov_2.110929_1_plen_53_part_10